MDEWESVDSLIAQLRAAKYKKRKYQKEEDLDLMTNNERELGGIVAWGLMLAMVVLAILMGVPL